MQRNPCDDVYTDLRALVRLKYTAQGFSYLPGQPQRSLLSGRWRSKLRGRGLDFDELRHYQPGDDIRNMDWRVTNRTGKPHVRAYTEERDRPVVAVVDQRQPMFFGSRVKMKSVVAAEVAAITAWRVLAVGDRIGAILFNDSDTVEARPTRSDKRTLEWLGRLTAMNHVLSAAASHASDADALTRSLHALERSIGHDHLVVVVSDFYGWNSKTLAAIQRIALHNDVVCALIYDPLERDISQANNLVVSDGRYQLQIDPSHRGLGEKFEASFASSLARVQADLRRHRVPVLQIDTVRPVGEQMRDQLGGG